jgi:hypothetical protein
MKKHIIWVVVVLECWVFVQACNRSNKWTNTRASINVQADSLMNDNESRNKWCDCVVCQFQKHYPDGENSIPHDSLGKLAFKYGSECSARLKIGLRGWTPMIVSTFSKALLRSPLVKSIKEQYQVPFCECYIQELKKKYPNGVNEKVTEEVGNEISSKCAKITIGQH